MPFVELQYRGHEVLIRTPLKGVAGRYVLTIGTLVRARPLVKLVRRGDKLRVRVLWDKDYGRFNKLLIGAFNQFFRELENKETE